MLNFNSTTLTIADLLRGDLQLASPPEIYFSLKKIADDPRKSPRDAAIIIENDAALAAKLLKIVNSAFYGFPSQISSVERAITLIGSRELQNLVLSTIIIERFFDLPGQTITMRDYWARNLRCALLSRELDLHYGKRYHEDAFVCGLLHNLGQLLFYRRIPVLAREVELLMESKQEGDSDDRVNIEKQVIGFDHYEAGAALCSLWKLPDRIVESIRMHCFADKTSPYADIAAIVRLAHEFSALPMPTEPIVIDGLKLSDEQTETIIEKINGEFEVLFKLFYPSGKIGK